MARKIMVGMSGGVDSSVAAYLLKKQGYEVTGVTFKLWDDPTLESGCCSADDVRDAAYVCQQLGIPHYVINYKELFRQEVVAPFAEEYLRGRTPDPGIYCNRYIKFGAVSHKLKELGYYHDNSRDYILQLMEITPTAANVARYAAIVQEKSMLRGLNQAATDIQQMVSEEVGTPAEMLESAEKKIYALRKGERGDSLEHIGTTLHKVFDRLTELSQSDSLIPGLSTGLRDLDTRINGLNKSDLLLIAARPAMGKSAFALNIGVNVAKKYKKTVAIFNLEMSREQLAMRLLASEGFVELQKLATGKLSEDEWSKLCMASAALSQTDIRIDDNPSVTVADINAKCRRLDNLGLVIIDYLQLMQGSGYGKNSDNRVTVVGEISRSLKIMAKELDVPVICLSQLSRASEKRDDKRPMLSDLRESGAIEQDADIVLFLYRDDYYLRTIDATGTSKDLSEYMGREGNYYYEIRAVGKTTNDAKYRKSSEYIVSSDRYLDDLGDTEGSWKNYADGKKYVDENGQIVTSQWYRILGTWYYFDENGYMVTGWRMVNNKWYYLGNDGKMVIGWKQIGGVWYYMDADGAMATGWRQTAPGQWYYLNANGAMAASTVIDGYTLDASGLWVS